MNEEWLQRKKENRIDYIKRITNLRTEYNMSYKDLDMLFYE